MTVLLLTRSDDNECVERVERAIAERGGASWRLDSDRFPTRIRLATSRGPGGDGATLRDGDRTLDLDEVTAVWHRRTNVAADLPASLSPELRDAARRESFTTLLGTLNGLDAFLLDPQERARRARDKLLQLRVAREAGLEVPRTLATNDPDAVRAFAATCDAGMVAKMMTSFAVHEDGEERVVFTNVVGPDDLAHLGGLAYGPMTFQERVPKRLELRATIVGERVFTASIDSQRLPRAQVDWRREGQELLRHWQPYALPADVERALGALMDQLGLNYGAADFVVTPGGRHVFLEVNPVGEFFWLELHPGLPLSEAIADVLLGRAPRR